jgi:hypothetical protein
MYVLNAFTDFSFSIVKIFRLRDAASRAQIPVVHAFSHENLFIPTSSKKFQVRKNAAAPAHRAST